MIGLIGIQRGIDRDLYYNGDFTNAQCMAIWPAIWGVPLGARVLAHKIWLVKNALILLSMVVSPLFAGVSHQEYRDIGSNKW
jgi:hypothetical protein